MTDWQIVGLIIVGAVVLNLFKRKKPQVFFIDAIDVWVPAPKKRMPPAFLNMAIVAGIILFIWVMSNR